MAKGKPEAAVPKLVSILESLDAADRRRAVQAAFTIMGEDAGGDLAIPGGAGAGGGGGAGGADGRAGRGSPAGMTEQVYFNTKSPKGKLEEFAVAARYREDHQNATTSSKAEIEAVIRKARRDFDSGNFSRDMSNAKRNGFFTTGGGGRDGHVLSHYGQRYVDALPDRDAAKKVPGGKKRGGPRKKKAAKK